MRHAMQCSPQMVPRLGVQMKMPKSSSRKLASTRNPCARISICHSSRLARSYRLATKHVNLDFVTSLEL